MSKPTAGRAPEELVQELTESDKRFPAYVALNEMGATALPAIKEGLKHGNWQVRRWCAMLLDHLADDDALHALVPLLRDPKSQVRLWAVHSISCEACKVGGNPIDTIPHLLERIEVDESIRVRRMAVAMLGHPATPTDARVIPALKRILAEEEDRKLRFHAERALERLARDGLPV